MCRSQPTSRILIKQPITSQNGFALFIVLMMVIAFLAVAVTQSYNTEMRIGSNDFDRKLAMSLAEAALRQGESIIADFDKPIFISECINGLCSAAGSQAANFGSITVQNDDSYTVAWERICGIKSCLEQNGLMDAVGKEARISIPPKFIIEFINAKNDGTIVYRVTARAWRQNNNTVVTVQTYVLAAQMDHQVTDKYQFLVAIPDQDNSFNYYLLAIPIGNNSLTMAAWMNSASIAYQCSDVQSAKALKVDGNCEEIS